MITNRINVMKLTMMTLVIWVTMMMEIAVILMLLMMMLMMTMAMTMRMIKARCWWLMLATPWLELEEVFLRASAAFDLCFKCCKWNNNNGDDYDVMMMN